eukprot:11727726-Alexandrium_andersonii.AAC.1
MNVHTPFRFRIDPQGPLRVRLTRYFERNPIPGYAAQRPHAVTPTVAASRLAFWPLCWSQALRVRMLSPARPAHWGFGLAKPPLGRFSRFRGRL